jgi:hypothetical protein
MFSPNSGEKGGYRHAARIVLAGSLTSVMLAFSLTPAFAALTERLRGAIPVGGGTLIMQESDASGALTSRSTDHQASTGNTAASTINQFDGARPMNPGSSRSVTTFLTNTGTASANAFTVTAGPCSQLRVGSISGNATDLCDKFSVQLRSGSTTVFDGTAAEFGSAGAIDILAATGARTVAAGGAVALTITITLAPSIDNTYQNLRISQPITWTFAG